MQTPTATIFVPYHAVDDLIQIGTRAAQPDAADVVPGTLYAVTDEGYTVERSSGSAWEPYGATGGGGTPGPPGPEGPAGPAGVDGEDGLDGATGAPGPPGPQGEPGTEGPVGPEGPPGTGIAIQGSVPTAGDLPPTGNPGDAWIASDTGHMWVWDDTAGAWVDAGQSQGPPGPAGPQGIQGEQGIPGNPGATGATGPAGADGLDGEDGAPGPPGPQGIQGVKGDKGDKGDTGASGAGVAHATTHQPGGADPMAVDAAVGTGSLRTLGGGAQQAAPGNHSHAFMGNVFGPGSAINNNLASFDATTGKLIKDSLIPSAQVARLDTGTIPVARLGAGTTSLPAGNTDTGTVHNWAPGLAGNTFVAWNGAAHLLVTGMAGGVEGQLVTIRNLTASSVLSFAHNSASSGAANRFYNLVASAPTPVAPGGSITYIYAGGIWQPVTHEQGAWITPPYSGAAFGPTSQWVVDAGDVETQRYRVSGNTLTVMLSIVTATISGGPANLQWTMPGGFQLAAIAYLPVFTYSLDGGVTWLVGGTALSYVNSFILYLFTNTRAAWPSSSNLAYLTGSVTVPIL